MAQKEDQAAGTHNVWLECAGPQPACAHAAGRLRCPLWLQQARAGQPRARACACPQHPPYTRPQPCQDPDPSPTACGPCHSGHAGASRHCRALGTGRAGHPAPACTAGCVQGVCVCACVRAHVHASGHAPAAYCYGTCTHPTRAPYCICATPRPPTLAALARGPTGHQPWCECPKYRHFACNDHTSSTTVDTHHEVVVPHPRQVHARALPQRRAPQVAVHDHVTVTLGRRAHCVVGREVL